ncbi:trk system potassium uptake protein TrkH [Deinobacterium chartae]|uniref:Trk system potassium uptake protein TrkH n=1 Tax=Deinobacterium chartae TaxID=521158 RepID=A0A841HWQ4_9DEIO|nr:TrkH family potassium uptake protein [Deinobacterium chartae]MBB6097961.1 trk system potassium uptake protein TrkH [Deinobacterium chartae]
MRSFRSRPLSPAQLIARVYAAGIVLGTALLMLPISHQPGQRPTLLEALFTATSSLCITGLSVVDVGSTFSRFGQVVMLLLFQAGGLGIITLGTLVALVGGRRLGFHDRLNVATQLNAAEVGGIVGILRRIVLFVFGAELVGVLLLYPRFAVLEGPLEGLFYAVFHSISAFNHAGFSLYPDGMLRFVSDPLVSLSLSALVLVGSLGFLSVMELVRYRQNPRRYRLSLATKAALVTSGVLLALSLLAVLLLEWNNPKTLGALPWYDKLLAGFFQAVTPRSGGFSTVDYGGMTQATLMVTVLLMFVGANPSSTGGGIKTTTFFVLVTSAWSMIRGRPNIVAFRRRIGEGVVLRAGVVAVLSLTLVVTALIALFLSDPQVPGLALIFETVSAFGTVGLSTGITANLSTTGQLVLIALMYLGRIGPLTFALAVSRPSRRSEGVIYPREDEIPIG